MKKTQAPENPYSSPANGGSIEAVVKDGVWRDGEFLVVRIKRHSLPDRCILCNAPARGDRRRIKLLPQTAAVGGRSVKIVAGYCREHIWQRLSGFTASMFLGPHIGRLLRRMANHAQPLTSVTIARGFVWVAGVSPEFLADLSNIHASGGEPDVPKE